MAGLLQLTVAQAASQSAKLHQVRPELAKAYVTALSRWMGDRKLLVLGLPFITEGYRADAVQAAYYAQGRAGLPELNRLRVLAGLPPFPFGSGEATRIITQRKPGTSNHNKLPSWALDVALLQVDGSVTWDNGALLLFSRLICYADARVTWGGDWDGDGDTTDQHLHDWPHFELVG